MPAGAELIREIDGCKLPPGKLAFWWLGQMGFVVKLGSKVLYLDAFLSEHPKRLVPPLIKPSQATNADFVLGSHDHTDHINRDAWPGIAAASPGAKFVVPDILREGLAADLDILPERFIGLDDGKSAEADGVRVTGVASAHEFLDRDDESGRYPYLGFVVEAGGCTFYHAGDTCCYEGLQTRLRKWSYDVVFLPINGRDARRLASGCIGNMTYQEAADLAGALRPKLTVPGHYEMFAHNGEDVSLFADYMKVKYPSLNVRVCGHGQRVMA